MLPSKTPSAAIRMRDQRQQEDGVRGAMRRTGPAERAAGERWRFPCRGRPPSRRNPGPCRTGRRIRSGEPVRDTQGEKSECAARQDQEAGKDQNVKDAREPVARMPPLRQPELQNPAQPRPAAGRNGSRAARAGAAPAAGPRCRQNRRGPKGGGRETAPSRGSASKWLPRSSQYLLPRPGNLPLEGWLPGRASRRIAGRLHRRDNTLYGQTFVQNQPPENAQVIQHPAALIHMTAKHFQLEDGQVDGLRAALVAIAQGYDPGRASVRSLPPVQWRPGCPCIRERSRWSRKAVRSVRQT